MINKAGGNCVNSFTPVLTGVSTGAQASLPAMSAIARKQSRHALVHPPQQCDNRKASSSKQGCLRSSQLLNLCF